MLTRSQRFDVPQSSVTADLGPGKYNPELPEFKPKCGAAPFNSTVPRETLPAQALITPGPGAYEAPKFRPDEIPATGTSAFQSKRLRLTSVDTGVPGPGSYEVVPSRPRIEPPQAATKMHSGRGINWVKVATAPSIPTTSQSYGYEEGVHGELVQQGPAVQGHSGEARDKPGPGEYDPSVALVKRHTGGTRFGGSTAARLAQYGSSVPGPGTYTPEKCGTSVLFHGGVAASKPHSVFMSRSRRAQLGGDGSGSGFCKASTVFHSLREHLAAHPESFDAFGSSLSDKHARVPYEPSSVPGPGSYQPSPLPWMKNREKPSSVFKSSASRFRDKVEYCPGPGCYEPTVSLTQALDKKIRGKFGVFGTTSPRDTASMPSHQQPAVAAPPVQLPKRHERNVEPRKEVRQTSAFKSHTKRGFVTPTEDVPFYDAKIDWPKATSTNKKVFCTSVPRFPTTGDTGIPGPTAYDVPQLVAQKPGQSFSTARRFDTSYATGVPGPGTYAVPSSLIRKTFNITIGSNE